jgi:hypothetical protein
MYLIINCYIAVSSLMSQDNAQCQFHESSVHLIPLLADDPLLCFILMLVHRPNLQGYQISHPMTAYCGGT